jgi:hypothetical protein
MDDSEDPVRTGIDLIVSEALAAPQFAMDECAERVVVTIKSLLSGGPVAKGGLGQSPAALDDDEMLAMTPQPKSALRRGGNGGGASPKKSQSRQRLQSTPKSTQQKQKQPKPPPQARSAAASTSASARTEGAGASPKPQPQVNLSEVEQIVYEG